MIGLIMLAVIVIAIIVYLVLRKKAEYSDAVLQAKELIDALVLPTGNTRLEIPDSSHGCTLRGLVSAYRLDFDRYYKTYAEYIGRRNRLETEITVLKKRGGKNGSSLSFVECMVIDGYMRGIKGCPDYTVSVRGGSTYTFTYEDVREELYGAV